MWCLARMFPILIGDLIPDGDEDWENLLCLLRIEEIVFSPVASTWLAAYLAVLVEQYLEEFKELYDRPLIPKHHNMIHYPRQIIRYYCSMQKSNYLNLSSYFCNYQETYTLFS